MHRYNIHPENIETITAVRFNPHWKPDLTTQIITNPDDAIESIAQDNPDMKVFTDGSGMEKHIGASMVLYRNGRLKLTLRYQLGSQHQHTVYEGEGIGALLGTKLIHNEWGIRSAYIYIDNCAAITATTLMKPCPGHYIFDALHNSITAL